MTILGSLNQETDFAAISEINQLSGSIDSAYLPTALSSSITSSILDQGNNSYIKLNLKKWLATSLDLSDCNSEYATLTAITLVQRETRLTATTVKLVATRDDTLTSPFAPENVIAESEYINVPSSPARVATKFVFDKPIRFNRDNVKNDCICFAFKNASDGSVNRNFGLSQVKDLNWNNSNVNQNPVGPGVWSSSQSSWYVPYIVIHIKCQPIGKFNEFSRSYSQFIIALGQLNQKVYTLETIVNGLPAVIDAI